MADRAVLRSGMGAGVWLSHAPAIARRHAQVVGVGGRGEGGSRAAEDEAEEDESGRGRATVRMVDCTTLLEFRLTRSSRGAAASSTKPSLPSWYLARNCSRVTW